MKNGRITRDEGGSILVLCMLMLVMLTLMGITMSTTSTIEIQIASNDRQYKETYYVADSGWKEAAGWLQGNIVPPMFVNPGGTIDEDVVKNFGAGGDLDGSNLNLGFPAGTQDQTITIARSIAALGSSVNVPYWYRAEYVFKDNAPGSGPTVKRFNYDAISVGDASQRMEVRLRKEYDLGY